MKFLSPLTSGHEDVSIWDRVWSGDSYASPDIRTLRAGRRLKSFGLLNGSVPPGAHVLDVGCGAGDSLAALSEVYGSSLKLTGADFSKRAVATAHTRLGNRANIINADVTNLPFPDEQFSHVLLFGLLEHVRDHNRALSEIHRVCAPGALVFISTSNAASVLQGINIFRKNTLGYPYGYQRNISLSSAIADLYPFFQVQKFYFEHADSDMPLVRSIDKIISNFYKRWSRYIHIICRKKA